MLCGDVWGVWIGFGIVAAGTILGELGGYMYAVILILTFFTSSPSPSSSSESHHCHCH